MAVHRLSFALLPVAAMCFTASAEHHTSQCWNFENNPPTDPSQVDNPFGTPTLTTDGTHLASAGGGSSGFGPRNGVYSLTDDQSLIFFIPNMSDANSIKTVHLSVEFILLGGTGDPPPLYTKVDDPSGMGFDEGDPVVTLSMPDDPDDHWMLWEQDFTQMPCPESEVVVVKGPGGPWKLYVSNVCITTVCEPVPAPGVMAVVGVAVAWVVRRR